MYSYHIHSTLSDGQNTPEEILLTAIQNGYRAIGFSDHGYTPFDARYCIKDQADYIRQINRLKEKYASKIQVYLGVEEDAFSPLDRQHFDYIIGSCHYVYNNGKRMPIDSNETCFKQCLASFNNDPLALAESYYSYFCHYIKTRKPDIIGHFDLITKFDELEGHLFLDNPDYHKIAEKYITQLLNSDCIFEINTGAIARGMRTTAYPYENLLYILQKNSVPVILSSDSHSVDTLDFAFEDTKKHLKDIGFKKLKVLYNHAFVDCNI